MRFAAVWLTESDPPMAHGIPQSFTRDGGWVIGSKKAGETACPTNSGQVGQAVSPANPDFPSNSAGQRPSPTDDKNRSSVLHPALAGSTS